MTLCAICTGGFSIKPQRRICHCGSTDSLMAGASPFYAQRMNEAQDFDISADTKQAIREPARMEACDAVSQTQWLSWCDPACPAASPDEYPLAPIAPCGHLSFDPL
jgi:hypothetical protein